MPSDIDGTSSCGAPRSFKDHLGLAENKAQESHGVVIPFREKH